MRISTKAGVAAASLTLAAGAVVAGTLTGGAQASAGIPAVAGDHPIVDASASPSSVASPNKAGRAGWQGVFTYSLPAGSGGVFFHYACPSGFIARSGLFDVNAAGQPGVKLVGQGPRYDIGYTEWFNTLLWPGGAPSGVTINFDVNCTKAPA